LGRNQQLEQEDRADIERLVGLDERPSLGDVLRVIVEERVQPLVLDLELDGGALLPSTLFLFGLGFQLGFHVKSPSVSLYLHAGVSVGRSMVRRAFYAVNQRFGYRVLVWGA